MLPTDDCDDCIPDYLKSSRSAIFFSSLPFLITFATVSIAVIRHLFPLLSGETNNLASKDEHNGRLPSHRPDFKPARSTSFGKKISLLPQLSAITLAQL